MRLTDLLWPVRRPSATLPGKFAAASMSGRSRGCAAAPDEGRPATEGRACDSALQLHGPRHGARQIDMKSPSSPTVTAAKAVAEQGLGSVPAVTFQTNCGSSSNHRVG